MTDSIKVGISACLLGEKVRYDGGHKLDRYLKEVLGSFVEWVPVCPEYECGLSIPREAMRLVKTSGGVKLLTRNTHIDHTGRMIKWIDKKLRTLEKGGLCGFIFKTGSPSSGMRDVKIYTEKGMPLKKGAGLFADAFMKRFPDMPVEDEGRLNDLGLRENFIERIFVMKRWQNYIKYDGSSKGLIDFHMRHKLLFMSHSQKVLKDMGALAASCKRAPKAALLTEYFGMLTAMLKLRATAGKNANVLLHAAGYFKNKLSSEEKRELNQIIKNYHDGVVPLIVPVTLINHFVMKYKQEYLAEQVYLNPHPKELMLRNHV